MSINRRDFIGLAGLSAFTLLAPGAVDKGAEKAARSDTSPAGRATRWAMAIDVRRCLELEGCVKCCIACHGAHNVPAIADVRHEVKWTWKQRFEDLFPSSGTSLADAFKGKLVPTLCNHCEKPPCVRVCPTQATWKRADGIVMMDWHRCIGCRYCMAACPYGSRSFNWVDPRPYVAKQNPDFPTRTKGVVEKCNLCEERLAIGKSPACCEACPPKALVFGNLDDPDSEIRQLLRARFSIQRRPELGTGPQVYYIV